jgi:hypothetical protein
VSFDFVCGLLVEFVKKETRFRLVYTFLSLLGLHLPDREFSNLVNSAAAENYFNHDKIQSQASCFYKVENIPTHEIRSYSCVGIDFYRIQDQRS